MLEAENKDLRNNISAVASDLLNYKTLNQGRGLELQVFGIFNNMIIITPPTLPSVKCRMTIKYLSSLRQVSFMCLSSDCRQSLEGHSTYIWHSTLSGIGGVSQGMFLS